jgi:hypothetical protein
MVTFRSVPLAVGVRRAGVQQQRQAWLVLEEIQREKYIDSQLFLHGNDGGLEISHCYESIKMAEREKPLVSMFKKKEPKNFFAAATGVGLGITPVDKSKIPGRLSGVRNTYNRRPDGERYWRESQTQFDWP